MISQKKFFFSKLAEHDGREPRMRAKNIEMSKYFHLLSSNY